MNNYNNTIDNLVRLDILKDPEITKAFRAVNRKYFMPEGYEDLGYIDNAFSIGYGQTISQPLTIAIMIELLNPQKGNSILEIGYGSGWLTAILSEVVGKNGKVHSYEIIKKLAQVGEQNIKNHFNKKIPTNIHLYKYDFEKDFLDNAPYNKIISSASFSENPEKLSRTLENRGTFVFPTIENDIRIIENIDGKFTEEKIPGFIFVPITH